MNFKTKRMVQTAVMLAIATVLSVVSLFRLPFGGEVTPAAMLPVLLIAYVYGVKWGLFSAAVYGLLQMLTGMNVVAALFMPGDSQMLVWQAILICLIDYIIAYTMLGFCGMFKNHIKNPVVSITVGAFCALLLRYIMHIISGYIFYGAWAEWFFTQEGFYSFGSVILGKFSGNTLSLVYSVIYNGLYMIPETVITVTLIPIVYGLLKKSKMV